MLRPFQSSLMKGTGMGGGEGGSSKALVVTSSLLKEHVLCSVQIADCTFHGRSLIYVIRQIRKGDPGKWRGV